MKRIIKIILCGLLVIGLFGCTSNDDPNINNPTDPENIEPETKETRTISTTLKEIKDGYAVTVSAIPDEYSELIQMDLTNEYVAGMAMMCVLYNFENNYEKALVMFDYIMGSQSYSAYDESFINGQIYQYPYVIRSYFKGTSPENGYEVKDYTIEFTEGVYSRDFEGYVKLFVQSSGADSPRSFTLVQSGENGEWFLSSDTYKGIMAGIRPPKS